VPGLDFSFSGIKTAFLYFIRDQMVLDPDFAGKRINDICASLQRHLVDMLLEKLEQAAILTGISEVAIAGGVSANSRLRRDAVARGDRDGIPVFVPALLLSTDNAAMIAAAGLRRLARGDTSSPDFTALASFEIDAAPTNGATP
jgi:N6-L-threonylcarbamoyladenine synthase